MRVRLKLPNMLLLGDPPSGDFFAVKADVFVDDNSGPAPEVVDPPLPLAVPLTEFVPNIALLLLLLLFAAEDT